MSEADRNGLRASGIRLGADLSKFAEQVAALMDGLAEGLGAEPVPQEAGLRGWWHRRLERTEAAARSEEREAQG